MPRFAANLTMLFTERPFLDRFAAAAQAGFKAVEFLFPYDFEAEALAARLREHRLLLVLHNLPAGDWAAGERGIACHPGREEEFRAGVERALAYARVLGTPRLNCLVGIRPAGVTDADARATLIANLRFAAQAVKAQGIPLLIEPINTFDIPGFFLSRTQQALDLIDAVGSDNLFLQYDLYHAQRMEGELTATLRAALPRIGHIQLADNPGRNEPGTGEINYRFLFDELDRLGYHGHIGCEYKPTDPAFAWVAAHGQTL